MKLINRKGSLSKEAPDLKRPTQFSVETSIKATLPPSPSDRNVKENFAQVDGLEVLTVLLAEE